MSEHPTAHLYKTLSTPMVGAKDIDGPPPWDQLQELYSVKPHLLAAAALFSAAVLPTMDGRFGKVGVVTAIVLAQVLLRVIGDWCFQRRSRNSTFGHWLHIFIALSLLSGLAWGASLTILYLGSGPEAQVIVLAVGCGIVQSTAARAYMAPASTMLVIVIMVGFVNVAAISQGNWLMLPICLSYMFFQASYMMRLIALYQGRSAAEQQRTQLLGELAQSNEKLRQANAQLQRHAATDGLTGLANRRSFDADLKATFAEARTSGRPLSLLLLDVDHFKRFNDTHGHLAGDECLRRVALMLMRACDDPTCYPARYGGEEFAVIMPDADGAQAEALAESLIAQSRALDLGPLDGATDQITLSIGLATSDPDGEDDERSLLDRADQGLYAAKQAGRNCVRSVERPMPVQANA